MNSEKIHSDMPLSCKVVKLKNVRTVLLLFIKQYLLLLCFSVVNCSAKWLECIDNIQVGVLGEWHYFINQVLVCIYERDGLVQSNGENKSENYTKHFFISDRYVVGTFLCLSGSRVDLY